MITYKGLSTYNRYKKFRLTDFELAKQDLFNHFHIRKGEKLMNPNFGTIIWSVLFEPFTEEIKTAIVSDIRAVVNYDPRVTVDQVEVTQFEYGIQVGIALTYVPTDQTELMKLRFDQNSQSVSVVQ
jgi:phage baseplate assembly protein W